MFGMGPTEIILILALALIVIGPKKLPDLAKSLGRALGEFKKAASDFKDTVSMESTLNEVKDEFKEIKDKVREPFSMNSAADNKASDTESASKTDDTDSGSTSGDTKETADSEDPPNPYDIKTDQTTTEGEKDADSGASPETDTPPADSSSPGVTPPGRTAERCMRMTRRPSQNIWKSSENA